MVERKFSTSGILNFDFKTRITQVINQYIHKWKQSQYPGLDK